MIISFIDAWLSYDVAIMAFSMILINVRLLQGEQSQNFLIARIIVAIALVILEVELCILNILQGESYWTNIFWFCVWAILTLLYGISLRNNSQQNKK